MLVCNLIIHYCANLCKFALLIVSSKWTLAILCGACTQWKSMSLNRNTLEHLCLIKYRVNAFVIKNVHIDRSVTFSCMIDYFCTPRLWNISLVDSFSCKDGRDDPFLLFALPLFMYRCFVLRYSEVDSSFSSS